MSETFIFSIAMGGFEKQFRSCIASQREYCGRRGYKYVLIDSAQRRLTPKESAWIKIPLMKAALAGPHEWAVFLDADVEVRPHTPSIARAMATLNPQKSLFFAPGHSGRVNSGVLIGRRDPSSIAFFEEVLAHADESLPEQVQTTYENGHVIHFAQKSSAVHLLEHRLWNNNSVFDPEAYLQHYSRGPLRDAYLARLEAMTPPNRVAIWRESLAALARRHLGWENAPTKRSATNGVPAQPEMPIVRAMADLLPYYMTRYPAFGQTLAN